MLLAGLGSVVIDMCLNQYKHHLKQQNVLFIQSMSLFSSLLSILLVY